MTDSNGEIGDRSERSVDTVGRTKEDTNAKGENMRFTAIDIETTGLGPEKARIIEIGAVKYEDG